MITPVRPDERVSADAIPQLKGPLYPNGTVLYLCGGTDTYKYPEPTVKRCGRKLFIWVPSARGTLNHGTIEIKCLRCRAVNVAHLSIEK